MSHAFSVMQGLMHIGSNEVKCKERTGDPIRRQVSRVAAVDDFEEEIKHETF